MHQENPLVTTKEIAEALERDPVCQRVDSEGNIFKVDYNSVVRMFNL
jgi:hypothetical protein